MSDGILDTLVAIGRRPPSTASDGPNIPHPQPSAAAVESVSAGTPIGRYLVLSKLGEGGMGVVLAAYDPQLDRKVALKLLKGRSTNPDRARKRLQREAQALAKLDHPNVVGVHDVGMHEGQLFVGMEFVEGQTLSAWMMAVEVPRRWPEVLRVFTEAGRGLAAAHEAGLIHRDFKPDNVMLGADGRVRVMDFGLARAEHEAGEMASESAASMSGGEQLLVTPLTRTGSTMGTPAYMSVEQFEAGEVDARSDQFGFCVALYEALYGELPFAGHTMADLSRAVRAEQVCEPSKGSRVPTWLRKVVVRGLSAKRERRWPSMPALLAALADDPAVRRRKWLAAAGVAGLLGGGAWALVNAAQQDAQTCRGADDKLTGVWDADRRAQVKTAIEATKLSYASGTWERVEQRLDDYTQQWEQARVEVCEATRAGEQSGELLDLRMACLDERLQHVRATVDVLAAADETVVNKAVQAVAGLPRLDRCADLNALTAEVSPPEDPAVARRVEQLDEQLVKTEALERAGKYDQGLAVVGLVVSEAQQLGYEPLLARAWLRQGKLQMYAGDYEGAEATQEQAYETALRQRMLTEAASASTQLVYVVGTKLARYEDGRRWAKDAKPLSQAVGTADARGAYLNALGKIAKEQGRHAEARDDYERALVILEEALGSDHPDVAASLGNLGNVALRERNYEEARGYHERALAILDKALGSDHPDVASSLNNLGVVALWQGNYAQARDYQERALVIFEQALGPDHPHLAQTLNNLGTLAHFEGNYEQARGFMERALAIKVKSLGPDHPDVANSLNNLGNVAQEQGKHEAARRDFERALAIREQALGPDHPDVANPLTGLGQSLLDQGDAAAAVPHLERALAIRMANDVDPTQLSETRSALAGALWDAPADEGRDRVRALTLAELAHDAYAEAGETSAKQLEALEAWQREHSGTR